MKNFKIKKQLIKLPNSGFSLVELILYITIIGGLAGAVSAMFISFSTTRFRAESQSELSQNARVVLEKIRQEVVKAVSINSPSAGASANSLNLVMASTWTCFQVASSGGINILQMSEGGFGVCGTDWQNLTSSKVSVDTTVDIFKQIANTSAEPTVQIKLKLIYNNRAEFSYSTQTTVGLR